MGGLGVDVVFLLFSPAFFFVVPDLAVSLGENLTAVFFRFLELCFFRDVSD